MISTLADRVLFRLARLLLRLLASTWRITEEVPEECAAIVAGEEPAVIAFWHGGMLPAWYRFRQRGAAALVSTSRDGEILTRYLERSLGYQVIRGSSSRGGGEALAAAVEALTSRSVLVTPDGPRGPARQAKAGGLVAAERARRRVLLVGWRSRWCWRFGSWDSMTVPGPFSGIEIRYCIFDSSNNTPEQTQQAETSKTHSRRIGEEELARFSEALESLYNLPR